MSPQTPHFEARVSQIDGSTRTLIQRDRELVNRTRAELHSGTFFRQDRIRIADEDEEICFFPPLVTRIDIITDDVSIWDFPFAYGALIELSESEFLSSLDGLPERLDPHNAQSIFFDTQTVSGLRTCLSMQVVAGFPAARLARIYSLFKEPHLVFGLRTGGIGILNVANIFRFSVYPEPTPTTALDGFNHDDGETLGREQAVDRRARNGNSKGSVIRRHPRIQCHQRPKTPAFGYENQDEYQD